MSTIDWSVFRHQLPVGILALLVSLVAPAVVKSEQAIAQPIDLQTLSQAQSSSASLIEDLFELGLEQMQQAKLPEALATVEQVLVQRRAVGDRFGEAAALMRVGRLLSWQGEYDQSVDQLQNAVQLWDELEEPMQQAEALTWLGNSYRLQAKTEQAEATLREAIALHQSAKNSLGEAEALWFLGATFAQQDWSQAAETIAQALSLVQAESAMPEQRELEGRILAWMGLAAAQQDEWDRALADLQAGLEIQREVGDRLMQQVTLDWLGGVYRRQGQLKESLEAYEEALAIAQMMQVPAVIGQMQNRVGIAHYQLEQYAEALPLFEQAAETYDALDNREALAQVWTNIGDTRYQQNQLEAMATTYEKAASIYESVDKIDVLMNHLANQAVRDLRSIDAQAEGEAAVQEQEKFVKRLIYADFLLKLSREVNSPYHQARSLQNLAALLGQKVNFEMFNNRFETAIGTALRGEKINQEALALIEAVGNFSDKQAEIETIEESIRLSSVTNPLSISTSYSRLGKPQESVKFARLARLKAREKGDQELIEFTIGIEEVAYQTLAGWHEEKFAYQEAIHAYQKSLNLIQAESISKERDSYFVTLISIGQIHEKLGNYGEAEQYYQSASQLASQLSAQDSGDLDLQQDDSWGQSQMSLASVQASRGKYRQAIDLLEAAISQRKSLGKSINYPLLNNLASYYVELGEMQRAEALQAEVIQHYQSEYQQYLEDVKVGSWDFFCANQQADQLCQKIETETTPFFRDLLLERVATELSLKQYLLALSLSSRGVLQRDQGNYQAALESHQTALSLIQDEKDKMLEASILSNQASVYQDQAQYQLAYDAIQEALSIAETQQDISSQLQYRRELAEIYAEQGQFQDALAIHSQNLETARTIGLRPEEAATLYRMGYTHSLQGNYAEALVIYEQALTLQEEMGDQRDIAVNLDSIGILYRTLGQVDKALELHQQSLEMSQRLDNKQFVVASLQFLGSAYHDADEPDKALRYLQQALNLNQDIGNRYRDTFILEALAKLYLDQQQPDQAIAALEKSLALSEQMEIRPAQARALGLMGEAYIQQHQPEQALEALQRSLALAQTVENRPTEALALSHLGDLYAEESPGSAIAFYKQAVNRYETIRGSLASLNQETQQSYTDTVAETYRSLADLLLTQGRLGEAEQVLELLKIQEIDDFAPNTRSTASASELLLSDAEQQIIAKHDSLVALGQKLTNCQAGQENCRQLRAERRKLTKAFNHFLDELALQLQTLCDKNGDRNCLQPDDQFTTAAKDLVEAQANTLVISPLVLEDKVWILVASEGGILSRYESPVDRLTLGNMILELRQALESPNSDIAQLQAISQKVYQLLVEPVLQDSPDAENLVFALDRVTRYLPMGVLFDGERYLTEGYAISTVLSPETTNIELNTLHQVDETPVLALGLSSEVPGFSALPNVESELDAIVSQPGIYPGEKFLNKAFTLAALDEHLEDHKVLHLATHAEFVPNQKLGSFLVLGNGERLPIEDIRSLSFSNIELVVLSACETALGNPEQDGVEIPGLSAFFLDKGADAVMASLWAVDDQSTAVLMQQFYHQVSSSNPLTKAQAIQAVQKDFIDQKITPASTAKLLPTRGLGPKNAAAAQTRSEDFSHPYYWAPFILIGNGL